MRIMASQLKHECLFNSRTNNKEKKSKFRITGLLWEKSVDHTLKGQ